MHAWACMRAIFHPLLAGAGQLHVRACWHSCTCTITVLQNLMRLAVLYPSLPRPGPSIVSISGVNCWGFLSASRPVTAGFDWGVVGRCALVLFVMVERLWAAARGTARCTTCSKLLLAGFIVVCVVACGHAASAVTHGHHVGIDGMHVSGRCDRLAHLKHCSFPPCLLTCTARMPTCTGLASAIFDCTSLL